MSAYTDILYASRVYLWAMDSATTAYVVLDDGSKVRLGSCSKYNNTEIGGTWAMIPSDIASRVKGVYVSVTGAGGSGSDRYSGGASVYGYRVKWN